MPGTVIIAIACYMHACIELWPKLVWTNVSWNLCLAHSLHDMTCITMHANNNMVRYAVLRRLCNHLHKFVKPFYRLHACMVYLCCLRTCVQPKAMCD